MVLHFLYGYLPPWAQLLGPVPTAILWIIIGLVFWFFSQTLGCSLDGGQLGRHWLWFPVQCFLEEAKCYLPGGRKHRVEYIRERIRDWNGLMLGNRRTWTHDEIREEGLHEEAFFDMMGGRLNFWSGHLFLVLLWPIPVGMWLMVLGGGCTFAAVAFPISFVVGLFKNKVPSKAAP